MLRTISLIRLFDDPFGGSPRQNSVEVPCDLFDFSGLYSLIEVNCADLWFDDLGAQTSTEEYRIVNRPSGVDAQ